MNRRRFLIWLSVIPAPVPRYSGGWVAFAGTKTKTYRLVDLPEAINEPGAVA